MIMANPELPPIRACLFDMDGLLIDTEDLYTKCNNVILHEYGKPSLPWKIKAQLQGRPGPDAAEIFHKWAQLPVSRTIFTAKQAALQARIFPTTQPLPGVPLLLKTLRNSNTQLALATSSHAVNYRLKSTHLPHLFSAFPQSRRILGDDPRIPKGRGKPAPDIYLLALECINKDLVAKGEPIIYPEECLVFEDSVPGVEAGRRAGMRVVWCPHPMLLKEYMGREKQVLAGIAHGTDLERGDALYDTGANGTGTKGRTNGYHPRLDDGWAEMVTTLEGFDYRKYGIQI